MGLYLCVFDGDRDADGVDVGAYADFAAFRDYILNELEGGRRGSRFPILMLHPDSDGEWSVKDCQGLALELAVIGDALRARPRVPFRSGWQVESARVAGLTPRTAFDSFIDVDGEPLVQRLLDLTKTALQLDAPILFQ